MATVFAPCEFIAATLATVLPSFAPYTDLTLLRLPPDAQRSN